MGRFDVSSMRYLEPEHFRVLLAIEMGMKNHEMVPLPLISSISVIHRGATSRVLKDLAKLNLCVYERGKRYDGFRLTNLGYDFLALRALCSREVVTAVGNQIGVGKESDIYVGGDKDLNDVVLKFHRLGRISFRKLKEKRDYHKNRHYCSWLYLSRISALKEFSFLKALHSKGFSVPTPIDVCRHTVVMSLINGVPLSQVSKLEDPEALYVKLMKMIVRLASYGLIHGDFNQFNIMILDNEEPIMIDFPQMLSIDHPNAEFYFNRDVKGVSVYFKNKFNYNSEDYPLFENMVRRHNLDVELEASGFTKKMARDLNKAYDEGNFEEELSDEENPEHNTESDIDLNELEAIEEEGIKEGIKLKKTERFSTWLKDAQDHVEKLTVEEIVETELIEHIPQLISLPSLGVEKVEDRRAEADEEELEEDAEHHQRRVIARGKVTDTRSVYSCGSTIAPEEIKKRLIMDKNKIKKERLRVKGKQDAVGRNRRENANIIKEHVGWDVY